MLLAKIVLKMKNGYRDVKLAILKAIKGRLKKEEASNQHLFQFGAPWGAKIGPFEWLLRHVVATPPSPDSVRQLQPDFSVSVLMASLS